MKFSPGGTMSRAGGPCRGGGRATHFWMAATRTAAKRHQWMALQPCGRRRRRSSPRAPPLLGHLMTKTPGSSTGLHDGARLAAAVAVQSE